MKTLQLFPNNKNILLLLLGLLVTILVYSKNTAGNYL